MDIRSISDLSGRLSVHCLKIIIALHMHAQHSFIICMNCIVYLMNRIQTGTQPYTVQCMLRNTKP